jgi:hypothetical protein
MGKRIDVPGGGGVVVSEGESATVSTRADGARVVDLPGGGKVVFKSRAPARPVPASGGHPSKSRDIRPKAVLARVLKGLTKAEQEALGEAVGKLAQPHFRGMKDRQRALEAEVVLLKARLAVHEKP